MDHPLMITWMQTAHALTNPHERPRPHVERAELGSPDEPSPLVLLRPVPIAVRARHVITLGAHGLSDAGAHALHAA